MEKEQSEAIAAICVLAAMADGSQDDAEREQVKSVFHMLTDTDAGGPNYPQVFQKVMLKKTSATEEALRLSEPGARALAYEMALCVCDADGVRVDAEKQFLAILRKGLKLEEKETVQVEEEADDLARELLEEPGDGMHAEQLLQLEETTKAANKAATNAKVVAGATAASATLAQPSLLDEPAPIDPTVAPQADGMVHREIDAMALKYAILNAALELLPQTMGTLAIVPLQTKMVYRVGKKLGIGLDKGHIKEFISVVGVGMTGQVVENFMRDMLGKFAKKAIGSTMGKQAGKMAKTSIKTMTGPVMTFSTTYALGVVAKQYYAGGRKLSNVDLKNTFSAQVERGKALFTKHQGEVERTSHSLTHTDVLSLVRNGGPV